MKKKAQMGTNVYILCASFLVFTLILQSCLHYGAAADDPVAETRRQETETIIDGGGIGDDYKPSHAQNQHMASSASFTAATAMPKTKTPTTP